MQKWVKQMIVLALTALVLTSGMAGLAQRRGGGSSGGSFGGGGGSFGSRRSGGSSFGSSGSSSGSFGRSATPQGSPRRNSTFGRPSSTPSMGNSTFGNNGTSGSTGLFGRPRPNSSFSTPTAPRRPTFTQSAPSGSFGRTGGFSGSNGMSRGYTRSTNTYMAPGGISAPVRGYGGFRSYSFYWGAPAWYYYTPFHPAFYFRPPVYMGAPGGGYYEPGGFNFMNLIMGLFLIGIVGLVFFVVVVRWIKRMLGGNSRSYP